MKSLSLPLALTGFLVMPVSAEMYSPVASHTRAAVMVSNQMPRTGDSHVVPPNHDRPGQSDPARPREAEAVLRLEEELSSRENQPGDVFYAEVVDDVLAANGLVLVPLGSRVRGHLAGNGNGQLEEIRLVIDAIIVDEWEIPVTARVVETNPHFRHGQSPTEAAAKVAAGTAVGALLGRLVGGDANGAMHGGVQGAAVGTGLALVQRDRFPVLAAGSRIVVLIDEDALGRGC